MDPSQVSILVVEDDEFTRMALVEILNRCKYKEIVAVEDGALAYQELLANDTKYDLVLCDVMLPVMHGLELLDAIQKNRTLSHIPIVMTSSIDEMKMVTECLSKGAKDYLIKPVHMNTAKTLVRHVWLHRKNYGDGNKETPLWRNFEILKTLGQGTHGTVVLARRRHDGAVVSLKQIKTRMFAEGARPKAENEVTLLKTMYHVNITRFYDSFFEGDVLNIVMEYADSGNLKEVIRERIRSINAAEASSSQHPLSPTSIMRAISPRRHTSNDFVENNDTMQPIRGFDEGQVMQWFSQLVLAVSYLHSKNVLHRDLKCENVFLTSRGIVKLGDFGISKMLTDKDALSSTSVGTPECMSPEICRGEPYGKKADIWALGCILYEMVTLRRPFEAESIPEMFIKINSCDYKPIPLSYSEECRMLIQVLLQHNADKRPSIEQICQFEYVRTPIQAFLATHAQEFQDALVEEAKLHQVQPHQTTTPAIIPPVPSVAAPALKEGLSKVQQTDIKEVAMDLAVVGLVANSGGTTGASTRDWQDELGDELRSLLSIGRRRASILTLHSQCVTAAEIVCVLTNVKGRSHQEAVQIVKELLSARVLNVVASDQVGQLDSDRTFLRFQVDEPDVPLNAKRIWRSYIDGKKSPMEICTRLRTLAHESLHCRTHYPVIKDEESYQEVFVRAVAEFQVVCLDDVPRHEWKPFFVNLYNTMVLHGFVELGIPASNDQVKAFDKTVKYNVGSHVFSLADIRHGILRGNQKPPSTLFWSAGRQLNPEDPKAKYVIHFRDPRCVIALIESHAPVPCPENVLIIQSKSVDTALETYVENYCKKHVNVDAVNREVLLPKFFRIYRDDFGSADASILNWVSQYLGSSCPPDLASFRARYAPN